MRVGPDQVPEPSGPSRLVGVRRPGLTDMARLMVLAGLMGMARLGAMAVPGRADMADGTRTRLRISHDIQDAWITRLRHLDNSHPHANAKYPQLVRRGRPAR
jgi:hypothetical protein